MTKRANGKKRVLVELYKKLFLIREVEKVIIENYPDDEMKTPMHMSMGEEAIVVGITTALGNRGITFGTYRSHGLFLSVTMDTDKFLSEMYGKVNGSQKGKGGSMHLQSPENGLLGVSAVVSTTIPIAVGAAFASKTLRDNKITAVFFGDGAVDEGVFWESINIASLMKLPIIFVCEDNDLAIHTPKKSRRGYPNLVKIIKEFDIKVFKTSSTDAEEIYDLANVAIDYIEQRKGPVFMQCEYYRYLEHVGVYEDFGAGYRNKDGFTKWKRRDPIALMRNKLLKKMSRVKVLELEELLRQQIFESVQKAKTAQFPNVQELMKNVFYE